MKSTLITALGSVAAAALLAISMPAPAQSVLTLRSTDVPAGSAIAQAFAFNGFGCTGQNVSPSLSWSSPPAGTKSFALMVHDPDAQTGGAGFWHWVVIDIPANVSGLARGVGHRTA